MEVSKKLLLVFSLLLSACAAKFDAVEHSRVVNIKHLAVEAQVRAHCANPELARQTAHNINSDANWLVMYSQYIPNNTSMEKMSTELHRITDEFSQRYQNSTPPSKVYCELKLKNIISVVDVIQRTNARRAR